MIILPKFKAIRIPLGFSLFFMGASIGNMDSIVAYFIGCSIALSGIWIFTRAITHGFEGILWALIGLPLFFLAMTPNSMGWLSLFDLSDLTIIVARLSAIFVSGMFALISFGDD